MAIEDFLSDSEKIKWHSAGDVKIGEASYILYLTDERILAHKRAGLVLKRDRAKAIKYEEVLRG